MSFCDRLIAETAAERADFLSIPLIQRTLANGAPPELYRAFLGEAYHHVKHTFPLLALAAARTTDERYQDALVEYMEEERGHEKWILDDIAAMGGDASAVRDGAPGFACRVMVGYAYYAIERVSPYAMLGSIHVLEGMSVLLADRVADAVGRSLKGGSKGGFSYLRSHGGLDVEHVAFFRTLVDGIQDSDVQTIVIEQSRIFYRLYGQIFRDLDVGRSLAHAA
ncbi:MAG: iron-containing redox enzyme family protein [Ancylobacter novellus]|uniref:Iron-containing redox enzyme family protein n=1 Tax=Ancylobacter novellus TaxID=921 RepID=A0A2W5MCY3_ANCNO|nr:MAG: iron-containing redox enzyme family protein [Ancylobacter novellus]